MRKNLLTSNVCSLFCEHFVAQLEIIILLFFFVYRFYHSIYDDASNVNYTYQNVDDLAIQSQIARTASLIATTVASISGINEDFQPDIEFVSRGLL